MVEFADYSHLKAKLLETLEAETDKTPYSCVDQETWHNKPPNYLSFLTNESEDESREWGLLKDNRVYFLLVANSCQQKINFASALPASADPLRGPVI